MKEVSSAFDPDLDPHREFKTEDFVKMVEGIQKIRESKGDSFEIHLQIDNLIFVLEKFISQLEDKSSGMKLTKADKDNVRAVYRFMDEWSKKMISDESKILHFYEKIQKIVAVRMRLEVAGVLFKNESV